MARIAGVDLPPNKRVEYGLTAIFGIGLHTAQRIVAHIGIDRSKKIKDLTDEEVTKIRKLLESDYRVEGALRAEIAADIKRLIDIGCYRGIRHKISLPARGQRTRTNARTRKGRKKTVSVYRGPRGERK
ncbi:30S ribosomal protein S13 [candidate division WOR_3 bacterium SM23_42]|uniref:Small ribosomal subunit protein uS13 n=1 Tax=candidate division WOR_3 bacterium SM23_42 TaxID=1703779 RepID=A0A0S8FW29_UNCW3|nr:MAG: 30S ribosomal protein S13 [candidate division WOR_3 bacterium SM23_42]